MPLLGDLGLPTPGYQGRLRAAAYVAPSGLRSEFQYTSVRRSATKRTRVFQFADIDGHFVQQNGIGGREYPLRCIFTGDDHDLLATSFELSCYEAGVGRLEHPLYGVFDVVPVDSVDRRNDLVREANQSIVEVTFSTTLASVYPTIAAQGVNELLLAVDGFNVAAAEQFRVRGSFASALNQAESKGAIRAALGDISATLSAASAATAESRRAFDSNFRAINDGLDILVGQPLELARQMLNLIQAPARAVSALSSRLDSYARLAQRLFAREITLAGSGSADDDLTRAGNDFAVNDLVALGAVSGALLATTAGGYRSKPDALAAAVAVQAQLDAAVAWRETTIDTLGVTDTGESYQGIQEAGAAGVSYLVTEALSLLPERRLTLGRARTCVDLCAEFYGSVSDERLQFFIDSNRLTGSEILEVPRGRTVVYYA